MLVNPDLIVRGKQWPVGARSVAETLAVSASIVALMTAGYASAGDGGNANYIKGTEALGGFTDASGQDWKLDPNQFIYTPNMFGRLDTTTAARTATLKKFFDYIIQNKKPGGIYAGYYLVDDIISTASSYPDCSLNLRTIGGPVEIEYDAGAANVEYFITAISTGATSHCIDAREGRLTITANNKIQRGITLSSNSGGTTASGSLFVDSVTVTDIYAPSGAASGAAYGLDIAGPYGSYYYENNEAIGVSRHTSLDLTGDCKGHRISQIRVPFFSNSGVAENILNAIQDADGIFCSGTVTANIPDAPSAFLGNNWRFKNCQGRSGKFQTADAGVFKGNITHDDPANPTITTGAGFQNQYGSLKIYNGWRCTYAAGTLGTSYTPFYIQTPYPDSVKYSFIDKGIVTTDDNLVYLAYVQQYATGAQHYVAIDGVKVVPGATLATTALTRALVEFSALPLESGTSKKLYISVHNTDAYSTSPLIGYTNGTGVVVADKFGFEAVNNKTSGIAPTSNTRVFTNISGTAITTLTDYLINGNSNYSDYFASWKVDFSAGKMRGGNQFSFDIAGAIALGIVGGPTTNFPTTGFAVVNVESQVLGSSNYLPTHIRIDDQQAPNFYHYRMATAWTCPLINAAGCFVGLVTNGDADATLTPRVSKVNQRWNTPLTAPRTVTLSTTGVRDGDWFRITRSFAATGTDGLIIGSTGITLALGQYVIVVYSSTAAAFVVMESGGL